MASWKSNNEMRAPYFSLHACYRRLLSILRRRWDPFSITKDVAMDDEVHATQSYWQAPWDWRKKGMSTSLMSGTTHERFRLLGPFSGCSLYWRTTFKLCEQETEERRWWGICARHEGRGFIVYEQEGKEWGWEGRGGKCGTYDSHKINNTIVVFKLRFKLWLKLRVRLLIVADDVMRRAIDDVGVV
jgi:hypothetical protein